MDVATRQLQQLLNQAQQCPDVVLLKQHTGSTNDDVRAFAERGIHSILLCSETQSHGRGQRQRTWLSPAGNIYLSTLLQTRSSLDGRLALETALNILQIPSLREINQLKVKWPNDLYNARGKWGGILVEPIDPHLAIVGVGINLVPMSLAADAVSNLDQPISSLSDIPDFTADRIQLISEIYLAIMQAGRWFDHGSVNLAARFNHFAAFIDQSVEFEQIQSTLQGIYRGIANDGAVQIETSTGLHSCYQGRLKPLGTNKTSQTQPTSQSKPTQES